MGIDPSLLMKGLEIVGTTSAGPIGKVIENHQNNKTERYKSDNSKQIEFAKIAAESKRDSSDAFCKCVDITEKAISCYLDYKNKKSEIQNDYQVKLKQVENERIKIQNEKDQISTDLTQFQAQLREARLDFDSRIAMKRDIIEKCNQRIDSILSDLRDHHAEMDADYRSSLFLVIRQAQDSIKEYVLSIDKGENK